MYIPGRGWFAYNNCWVEKYGLLLQCTAVIQTTFLPEIQTVRSIAVSRNLFKERPNGGQGERSKYLTDLECELPDSFKIQGFAKNAIHFFAMEAPLDADAFILQLQNGTSDLRENVIRPGPPSTT